MRATIQKIFDYENLIDDLLRDYALKNSDFQHLKKRKSSKRLC